MTSLAGRLKSFNTDLLPDKVQLKYEVAAKNAFAFFRISCPIFYKDLAAAETLPLSPLGWICNDPHIRTLRPNCAAAAKSDYKSYLKAHKGGLL